MGKRGRRQAPNTRTRPTLAAPPPAVVQLGPWATEHVTSLERVESLAAALREVQDELGGAVYDARQDGATWEQIGDALGVSRQAATKRFGSMS